MRWNGYKFTIPYDADDFTIKVAREHLGLNPILIWLKDNTSRSIGNVLRHWVCESGLSPDGTVSASKVFLNETLLSMYLPREGLIFFKNKVIEEQKKKSI